MERPPGSLGRTPAMGQPQVDPLVVVGVVPAPPPAVAPEILSEAFMPRAACPWTGHQSESVPPVTLTVFECVVPGLNVPTATVLSPAPAMSSLCRSLPALWTTNVTLPALTDLVESWMWYSLSVTLTVAVVVAELRAATAAYAAPATASARATPAATTAVRV